MEYTPVQVWIGPSLREHYPLTSEPKESEDYANYLLQVWDKAGNLKYE